MTRRNLLPRLSVKQVARLVACVAVLMIVPVTSASAHAFLVASDPADGAALTTAPSQIQLQFSESVVLPALKVSIVGTSGRRYQPTGQHLLVPSAPAAGTDTEEPATVVVGLPALPQDAYRLEWQTLSSDDLHRTAGVVVFGIGRAVTAGQLVEPAPRAEEVLLRLAIFLSLGLVLGGLLAARILRRIDGEPLVPRRIVCCRRLGAGGAAAGMLFCFGLLEDQLMVDGGPVGDLLTGSYGIRFGMKELGFALLLAASLQARRHRVRALLTASGAALVGVATAMLSHSGAGTHVEITRVTADAVHLTAAAIWSGGLLVVLAIALPAARKGQVVGSLLLRGFGIPAASCFALMLTSGVYLSSGVIGSVDAALLTNYGRTLTIKVLVVLLITVLGLVNTARLHRVRTRGRPGVSRYHLAMEGAAAVAVLTLAAVLTSSQPANEPQFLAVTSARVVPVVDRGVDDLQESLAVRPNVPGRNVVLLDIFQTRRPAPGPIRQVLVSIGSGQSAPAVAEDLGEGHWSVPTELTESRSVQVTVTVRRSGVAESTAHYDWVVGGTPAAQVRSAVVSNAPVRGILVVAAAILAALTAAFIAFLLLRKRRQYDTATAPDHAEPEEVAVG